MKLIWERIAGDFTPHFIASQLVIMALGMLPLKYWRGIQTRGRQISTDRAERLLRFDVSLQSWKLKRNSFMPRGGFDQGRIKHTNFEDETPGDTAWRLILSDNPTEIARVEAAYGRTQAQTVDDFIEHSCWSEIVPSYVGGKGTARERLSALRAAYARENPGPEARA